MGEKINLIKIFVKPLLGVRCLLAQAEKGQNCIFKCSLVNKVPQGVVWQKILLN